MDIRKLQRAIVDALEDVKAQAIVVFNTEHLSPLFERVIIASGTSNRQTKALASSVRETVKARGLEVMRTEGEDNGEWIIVDCGAAVVHIMQPAIREYYHLEEIWGDKPVRLKAAEVKGLVKASEPMHEPAKPSKAAGTTAAAQKATAKKVTAKKAAVKSPSAKGASPAEPARPKVASRKTAGAGVAKTAPAKAAKPARSARSADPRPTRSSAGPASATGGRKAPAKKASTPVKTIKVGDKKPVAKPSAKASAGSSARKPATQKTASRKSTRG